MKQFQPQTTAVPYPPYHNGPDLEAYFHQYYLTNKEKFDAIGYELIPVYWTNYYNMGMDRRPLQEYLDSLPRDRRYFTVSQHDDAVGERLPEGTLSFEAGGNNNGIPIPLICSSIGEYEPQPKSIFASFVGSLTHQIRQSMHVTYYHNPNFTIFSKGWQHNIPQTMVDGFIDVSRKSRFCLCPRGYGASSFRFYEVLQLGSVPVYLYDKDWFPFSDEVDWNRLCVMFDCRTRPMNTLENLLRSIPEDEYQDKLKYGQTVYKDFFTLEGMASKILSYLGNNKI